MRKRQKLILVIYVYAVLFLGFLYVPYVRYYPNGAKKFIGHHFRSGLLEIMPWDSKLWGNVSMDANLIIAEILAITAIAVVAFLLFKRE
jgi:hypothetical protein